MNEAEAIAALEADSGSEQAPVSAEAPGPESTSQTAPVAAEQEFLPRADLDALLEGVNDPTSRERIERAYQSFQGDYTRKTQELAEQRKAFEGLDPQAAREAYDFVNALQHDRDFALQVHKELSGALEAAGLSPAQAQAEATRQIASTVESELDPSDPVVQKLQELEQWKAQQEQEWERQRIIRDIERQDAAIRKSNPSYGDEDMDVIYKLAASTAGNLFQAEEYFRQMKDRFAAGYQAQKASVPSALNPISSGASETPSRLTNMDEAHRAAVDRLQTILNSE